MNTEYQVASPSEWQTYSEEEFIKKFESLTEKDIAVFDEVGSIPTKDIHSDGHVVAVCLAGRGCVTIGGKRYDIERNGMFICHPNQFIKNVMISYDFKFCGLLMSSRYFQSVFYLPGKIWKAGFDIMKHPIIPLDEEEANGFRLNYEMLKYKLAHTDLPHHSESIKLLLQSLVYEMYDVLAPKLQINYKASFTHSAGELLFARFVSLLTAESPRHHSVSYYADRLCVTPKYLSTTCKKQTGKTASCIIDQATTNYIKQMLSSTEMSITEIATEAGFCNLSFFGKYVKRELGMSPREFRLRQ